MGHFTQLFKLPITVECVNGEDGTSDLRQRVEDWHHVRVDGCGVVAGSEVLEGVEAEGEEDVEEIPEDECRDENPVVSLHLDGPTVT
jgi:hypothetical protein